MGVFCSLLKLSDPVIGFIAGLSQFAGCFMYTFAYSNLMIYLGGFRVVKSCHDVFKVNLASIFLNTTHSNLLVSFTDSSSNN